MTDRIRNESPLEGYHNSLDFGYMIAAFIGFFSTLTFVAVLIFARPIEIMFIVNAVLCLCLLIGGVLGFYWHFKGNILKEFHTIIPILMGLSVVMVLYMIENITNIVMNVTLLSTAGVGGGIIVVLMIYLVARYKAILRLLKEAKKTQDVIDQAKSL